MHQQSGQMQLGFAIFVIAVVMGLAWLADSAGCHARWKGSGVVSVSWGPLQGCKVKLKDGRWLPEDVVKEIDIK